VPWLFVEIKCPGIRGVNQRFCLIK